MKLTLKFLDQQVMKLEVGDTSLVSDLISLVEDRMGRENMYKMIHAGKLLQEDTPLADYSISGSKLPVVVMVTKSVPRVRTESEDSGYGDDYEMEEEDEEEEEEGHYVTDMEFKIALEVVIACSHLNRGDQERLSKSDMEVLLREMVSVDDEVKTLVSSRLHLVHEASLSRQRFDAFVMDIQSIYEEAREVPESSDVSRDNNKKAYHYDPTDSSDSDDDEMDEDDYKVKRITNMGFSEEDALNALRLNCNNVHLALEHLLPQESAPRPQPSHLSNPLDFLREIDEYQYLRYQVLHDPHLLKPLLLSFGESHPGLMAQINQNKDLFISMIHEQTGAKRQGRH